MSSIVSVQSFYRLRFGGFASVFILGFNCDARYRKIDFGIRLKGENVQYWRIPKDIPMMEGCSEALFE